ncbi:putative HicB family protein [Burkholderia lata]|uniref:Putative HicB family protein n=1 Tax=Burkholderia lata (strain ATCC 17760 / DSM 23089 / LMG 22485 / NCIMB 9086 / R18194 / 383) TaxID=482957 RepID=A0A6P2KKD7_BURL3|nr:putative HicB family protein [Burkholderia lata]
MNQDHFTYRVTWSPEDGEHVGLCAEFLALSWLDGTPEGALAGIRQLVAEVVRDMARKCPSRSPTEPTAVNSRSASRRRRTARW